LNPEKARLVAKAEDWLYSSYPEYIGLKNPIFINRSIILEMISDYESITTRNLLKEYKDFVEDWDFEYMSFRMK
jgi:hypothetical protein